MALLILLMLSTTGATAASQRFSHDDWTEVLSRYVNAQGLVDYEGLAQHQETFRRYISAIESIGPTSHPELFPTDEDRLAYYLNAYNALVFAGVLARGPEAESVWKGGLISGYRFFVGMKVVVGGEKTHLKKLEDEQVRKQFRDPRVHAALNCASVSCPRLPREAFDPGRLDEQLDAAMREFVGSEKHVRVDAEAGVVYLSKIFDWFSKDFLEYERARGNERATLIDYVNRYREERAQIPGEFKIKFLNYDKGINSA